MHWVFPQGWQLYSWRRSAAFAGRAVADGWRLVGKSVARAVGRVVDDNGVLIDEGELLHTAVAGHNPAS